MGGALEFGQFVIGLAGVGVAGFVGWVIASIFKVKSEISALRLHVAENYATNPDIQKMESHLADFGKKIDSMLEMIYVIKAEVGVRRGDNT